MPSRPNSCAICDRRNFLSAGAAAAAALTMGSRISAIRIRDEQMTANGMLISKQVHVGILHLRIAPAGAKDAKQGVEAAIAPTKLFVFKPAKLATANVAGPFGTLLLFYRISTRFAANR